MHTSALALRFAAPILALLPFATLVATETQSPAAEAAALFQLGAMHMKQQRIDEAIDAHEKATRLDPTRAEYFSQYAITLGAKLQRANFMQQAMLAPRMQKAFAKSLKLDPDHLPGLIGLTRFYSHAPEIAGGSSTKAKQFAQRIKALNPFLGEMELGHIAERDDDFAAALAHFTAASSANPDHAAAQLSAGRMLVKLGRIEEARRRFETALQRDPKREAARKALAELPVTTDPK